MGIWLGPYGGRGIKEGDFSYDGNYLFTSDGEDWELALLDGNASSLLFHKNPGKVDMCIVGAGQLGADGHKTSSPLGVYVYSGKGGDGGRVLNVSNVSISRECSVVIGTSGTETSISSNGTTYTSANAPAPLQGGKAASMLQGSTQTFTVNSGGTNGVLAYGASSDETMIPELAGILLAPSGGGGHANNNEYVYTDMHSGVNTGGQTGAGYGGTRNHHNGYNATGYGAGGGGGYADGALDSYGTGGSGGDGILLIRNAR